MDSLKRQRKTQSLVLETKTTTTRQRPFIMRTASEEEALDQVISLSPAVRAPIKSFKRRSTTRSALMSPSSSSIRSSGGPAGIDAIVEDDVDGKAYFGQEVNEEDLVAVNLEGAFSSL